MIRVPRCQGNQHQQISGRWSGSPDVREININKYPVDDQGPQMSGKSTSTNIRKMIRVPRCQGNQHQQMSRRWSGSPDVKEISIDKYPEDDQGPKMSGKSTSTNIQKMIRVTRCQGKKAQGMRSRALVGSLLRVHVLLFGGQWRQPVQVLSHWPRVPGNQTKVQGMFRVLSQMSDKSIPNKYPEDVQNLQSDVREVNPKQVSRGCSEFSVRCQGSEPQASV